MFEEKIINCTPHDVVIYNEDDTEFSTERKALVLKNEDATPYMVFESTAIMTRVGVEEKFIKKICGIPVYSTKFTELINLPPEEENTYYIVSGYVGKAGKEMGRNDLLIPSHQIRNEKGVVIGCTALCEPE